VIKFESGERIVEIIINGNMYSNMRFTAGTLGIAMSDAVNNTD